LKTCLVALRVRRQHVKARAQHRQARASGRQVALDTLDARRQPVRRLRWLQQGRQVGQQEAGRAMQALGS